MPKAIVVTQSQPDTPRYPNVGKTGAMAHDYIPDDADHYNVIFVRGRKPGVAIVVANREQLAHTIDIGRISVNHIATLDDAHRIAAELDAEHGQYGRRATIYAVKGSRGYNVPRRTEAQQTI